MDDLGIPPFQKTSICQCTPGVMLSALMLIYDLFTQYSGKLKWANGSRPETKFWDGHRFGLTLRMGWSTWESFGMVDHRRVYFHSLECLLCSF
jgi:hypothetical protein